MMMDVCDVIVCVDRSLYESLVDSPADGSWIN